MGLNVFAKQSECVAQSSMAWFLFSSSGAECGWCRCGPMKSRSSGLRSLSLVLKSPAMTMNDDGASVAMKAESSFQTLGRIESCCSPECGM